MFLDTRAVTGDAVGKTITDSRGEVYGYEKLLLAIGGAPRRLANADDDVIYFRTLDDYQRLCPSPIENRNSSLSAAASSARKSPRRWP